MLQTRLASAGIAAEGSEWHPYSGGRTNAIWRIGSGAQALVCKLYLPASASPLFPNDSAAEWNALRALSGTGLAPEPVATLATELGPCIVYRNVEGEPVRSGIAQVAEIMTRLHRFALPAGLRHLSGGSEQLRLQGQAILDDCRSPEARELRNACPTVDCPASSRSVFLHGDVVPSNVLTGPTGVTFIDWQCPAAGDAAEDIAIFLSPAMRSLYGGRPLSFDEQTAFLQAYGSPEIAWRYRRLEPLYHWRMAAHCLWKAERGAVDYRDALQLERAALEQFRQQYQRRGGREAEGDQPE